MLERVPTSDRLTIAMLIVLAAASFLARLGARDIVTSHEARVAQTARQMAASSWPWNAKQISATWTDDEKLSVNPWLLPVINGHLRLEKPPLPYWCTAILFRAVWFSETLSRLVPAILGIACTLLVWDVARIALSRQAAVIAALVFLTTYFIVDEFRKSMADPYLAFFTLLTAWMWLREWCVGFYVSLALGMLAKGPPMLVTIVPVVALSWLMLDRRPRASWWSHIIGIALFALIALPWPIYVIRHVPGAIQFWSHESVGRFGETTVDSKPRPWWLYVADSFVITLPWTPMWIAGVALPLIHRRGRRLRRRLFAIGCFLVPLIILSCAHDKKDAYLLPAVFGYTLTIAEALTIMLITARRKGFKGMPAILAAMQTMIGIGFALAMVIKSRQVDADRLAAIVMACIALIAAVCVAIPIVKRRTMAWLVVQSVAYAALLVAFIGFVRADDENRRSPKPFAREVERYMNEAHLPIAGVWLSEEAAVYLPLDLPDPSQAARVLAIVDDNKREFEPGKSRPNETFFRPYVGDVPILSIRRIDLPGPNGRGRWKLYELTLDRGPRVASKDE